MQALRPKLWAPLVLVLGGVVAYVASQGAPVEAADHNDPPNRVHNTITTGHDDRAADIADVFAWNNGTGGTQTTVVAMSFNGPNTHAALAAIPCDRDVLYQIHITSDQGVCPAHVFIDPMTYTCSAPSGTHLCGQYTPTGGAATDCAPVFSDMQTINVRFSPNGAATTATCVVEAEFVGGGGATPIAATPIVGAVETPLASGSVHLYAGLRDDAFFFDLAGFNATIAATDHMLHFTGGDSFANMNTPVVVLEFPTSAIGRSTLAQPATGNVIRVWGSTSRFHPHS